MSRPPAGAAVHRGGCRCGAVRFAATAAPLASTYCHCADCRRATGAPVSVFVGFPRSQVTFGKDGYTVYANGPVSRRFCARCGSPVSYEDFRLRDRIYFQLGAMDRPQDYPPSLHGFEAERLPFLAIDDALPRLPGFTVERPMTD